MKILAFTGLPFSGKSEAVKTAKDFDIPVFRIGDMIWEEVKKRGLEINDKNVGLIADEMRNEQGKDVWAKKTLKKIKSKGKIDFLVLDGIRNIEEVYFLKKELGYNFYLVAIKASDETRYKRAVNRRRKDDSQNLDIIKKRDLREKKWGIEKAIENSDFYIINEGELSVFKKDVKKLLKDIFLYEKNLN